MDALSRRRGGRAPEGQAVVYQVKVTLKGTRPPIWRRLLVPGQTSLSRLHRILQIAMGWEDAHLHAFTTRDGARIGSEARVTLAQLLPFEKLRLLYEYDFGDSWEHDILVERLLEPQEDAQYPRCIAGKGACPLEDVGGVWGYAELLEALQDPEHERRKEFLEWLGDDFDPKAFDLEHINLALRRVR